MVFTKLERSFDTKELHHLLHSTLTGGLDEGHGDDVTRIKRPPLPKGSMAFEMVSGCYNDICVPSRVNQTLVAKKTTEKVMTS